MDYKNQKYRYMLIFLLIASVSSRYRAPTLQKDACPSPEERTSAWNIGQTCDTIRRSCCFDELINDSNGTLKNVSCCYTYGTAGPIKCCGWTYWYWYYLGIILPIAGFIVLVVCLMIPQALANKSRKDNAENIEQKN